MSLREMYPDGAVKIDGVVVLLDYAAKTLYPGDLFAVWVGERIRLLTCARAALGMVVAREEGLSFPVWECAKVVDLVD